MSTSWSAPDPHRATAVVSPFDPAYAASSPAAPSRAQDVLSGLVAAVVTVLVGAPVGLLWAASAPRTEVLVAGQDVRLVQPGTNDFIAADGFFLFAVLLAGIVGGALAWALARAHGPAVVVGLAVGGLVAAYVAHVVGEQVGLAELRTAVQAGSARPLELTLKLRAHEALVGWPVGSMLSWLGASLLRER